MKRRTRDLYLTSALSLATISLLAGCQPDSSSDQASAPLPPAPPIASAASTAPAPPTYQPPTPDQLNALVSPIALFPDKLVALTLAASMHADDVQAARSFLESSGNLTGTALVDAADSQSWDPSVKTLVAFPGVVDQLASNPEWMTSLGATYAAEPSQVMDAVQVMRERAKTHGALKNTLQQKIEVTTVPATTTVIKGTAVVQPAHQVIHIEPAQPNVVYVPHYDPVTVYGTQTTTVSSIGAPSALPDVGQDIVTTSSDSGVSVGGAIATGVVAFGAGIAVDRLFLHHHHDNPGGWGDWNGQPPPPPPAGLPPPPPNATGWSSTWSSSWTTQPDPSAATATAAPATAAPATAAAADPTITAAAPASAVASPAAMAVPTPAPSAAPSAAPMVSAMPAATVAPGPAPSAAPSAAPIASAMPAAPPTAAQTPTPVPGQASAPTPVVAASGSPTSTPATPGTPAPTNSPASPPSPASMMAVKKPGAPVTPGSTASPGGAAATTGAPGVVPGAGTASAPKTAGATPSGATAAQPGKQPDFAHMQQPHFNAAMLHPTAPNQHPDLSQMQSRRGASTTATTTAGQAATSTTGRPSTNTSRMAGTSANSNHFGPSSASQAARNASVLRQHDTAGETRRSLSPTDGERMSSQRTPSRSNAEDVPHAGSASSFARSNRGMTPRDDSDLRSRPESHNSFDQHFARGSQPVRNASHTAIRPAQHSQQQHRIQGPSHSRTHDKDDR